VHLPRGQLSLKYKALTAKEISLVNKLAVLAFALLLFFSSMLWFLANGSLNQYLKSQVQLQGKYYTGQKTTLNKAKFSPNTLVADFTNLTVENINGFTQTYALVIDQATAQIASVDAVQIANLTVVENLTIDNVTVNVEYQSNTNNIAMLLQQTTETLAKDFPLDYPEISARNYAEQHPERNAALTSQNTKARSERIETAAAIEAKQAKKTSSGRKKIKTKIIVKNITINHLHVAIINQGKVSKKDFNNITFNNIGETQGYSSNQLGGELIKALFEEVLHVYK